MYFISQFWWLRWRLQCVIVWVYGQKDYSPHGGQKERDKGGARVSTSLQSDALSTLTSCP